MRILKAVLYLILSACVLWGLTVTLGPAIINVALSRSLGDQKVRITGLKVSPKLQISASRLQFDFSDNESPFYGTMRAPKFDISPTMSGWLVKVSSGLLQINNSINLLSFKSDFYTASISDFKNGQFSFYAPELTVKEGSRFSDISVSSYVYLSSSKFQNLTFSAGTASTTDMRNGDSAFLDSVTGRLAEFSLRKEWQSQSLDLEFSAEVSVLQSGKFGEIKVQSMLVNAQNDGPLVDTNVMADNLSMEKNGLYLNGIKAVSIMDPIDLTFQKEIRVQIEQGSFYLAEPNKMSGNIKGLEALVGLHSRKRTVQVVSNVSDLEIWNLQFPIFTIPNLALDIKAKISPLVQPQNATAKFKVVINGKDGGVLTGDLASKLSSTDSQDCLEATCVASDFLLDLKYQFAGEQIVANGSCPSGQCKDEKAVLTVETSNTAKIITGLANQKIINPIALAIFAGGVMQGEEIGRGHKASF